MSQPSKSRELTIHDLVPGSKVRALIKDVRNLVLELGSLTECTFYNGTAYRVRWKGCGLGMAEVWLEEKK